MADVLSALDWIAALLFAGALGMIALTDKEIRVARTLVLVAVGLFVVRWGAWALMSDSPWYIKALVGACVGAFLFGAIPPALRWILEKSTPAGHIPIPGTILPGGTGGAATPLQNSILWPSLTDQQIENLGVLLFSYSRAC